MLISAVRVCIGAALVICTGVVSAQDVEPAPEAEAASSVEARPEAAPMAGADSAPQGAAGSETDNISDGNPAAVDAGDEAAQAETESVGLDDLFIPSQEIRADEEIIFPVDI